jgi:hypothetical protein
MGFKGSSLKIEIERYTEGHYCLNCVYTFCTDF